MGKPLQPHKKTFFMCLLVGIGLLLPLIYRQPNYEELLEKEISVSTVDCVTAYRGGRLYYLVTADGERMEIRGELSYPVLQEALRENFRVTVKYYWGRVWLENAEIVKEMTQGGKVLVAYSGDAQRENQIVFCVVGLAVILVGYIVCRVQENTIRKEQEKRRKKLQKKYGDKYREPGKK